MKRLFVEIDKCKDGELETWAMMAALMHQLPDTPMYIDNFFMTVIENAGHKAAEVWEAIKAHDEIYASTALVPRASYGGKSGNARLFDSLMKMVIDEKVTGKKVFLLREYKEIWWWGELELRLVDLAFRKNYLYVTDEHDETWVQVDTDRLIREQKIK